MSDLDWQPVGKVQCVFCGWDSKFGGPFPTKDEAYAEMLRHPCPRATDE